MRKEKLVTRTIISTKAAVLLYNVDSKETHEEDFTISGIIKKDVTIQNKVKKLLEGSGRFNEKVVAVLSTENIEALYAITETAFIENAVRYESRDALAKALKESGNESEVEE